MINRKAMVRNLRRIVLAVAAAIAALYGADEAGVRISTHPTEEIPVQRMFAVRNRWGSVEYSVGRSGNERCVYALFPHQGNNPCWYVTRHRLQYLRVG